MCDPEWRGSNVASSPPQIIGHDFSITIQEPPFAATQGRLYGIFAGNGHTDATVRAELARPGFSPGDAFVNGGTGYRELGADCGLANPVRASLPIVSSPFNCESAPVISGSDGLTGQDRKAVPKKTDSATFVRTERSWVRKRCGATIQVGNGQGHRKTRERISRPACILAVGLTAR